MSPTPIISACASTIDHIQPLAHGGRSEFDNLATSCWPCNVQKSEYTLERLGWDPLPEPPVDDWDGLITLYSAVWAAARDTATPAEIRYHTA